MSLTKEFFQQLREGEQYASMFVDMELLNHIKQNFEEEEQYKLNSIKQVNTKHKEDELLCNLYKEKKKIDSKVIEREQELNHNK